jgi:hypothetical protein
MHPRGIAAPVRVENFFDSRGKNMEGLANIHMEGITGVCVSCALLLIKDPAVGGQRISPSVSLAGARPEWPASAVYGADALCA